MSRPAVLEVDPQTWTADALAYVEARVRAGHQVTADDLRRDLPEPPHPNLVGAVFLTLSRRRVIERTGLGHSQARTRRHGMQSVWALHHEHRRTVRHSKAAEHLARLTRGARLGVA